MTGIIPRTLAALFAAGFAAARLASAGRKVEPEDCAWLARRGGYREGVSAMVRRGGDGDTSAPSSGQSSAPASAGTASPRNGCATCER